MFLRHGRRVTQAHAGSILVVCRSFTFFGGGGDLTFLGGGGYLVTFLGGGGDLTFLGGGGYLLTCTSIVGRLKGKLKEWNDITLNSLS